MNYSKIILISLLICSYCSINAFTRDEVTAHIFIRHKPHGGTHLENYIPADQPDVYYNSGTQVSGTYDTIDVSSLAPDEYCITITSPTGHEFEGYFEIE